MAVNFELYKVFMAVATNKSFSKAAEELYVTQSAVSQSISKLEKELGKQLFKRGNFGITLTQEGKFLFETISTGYNIFLSAENIVKNENIEEKLSTLKVACSPILFKKFVFPFLQNCLKKDMNVVVNSLLSDKDKLLFVKEDLLNFCIIKDYGLPIDLSLFCKKIYSLHYVFFYNPKHINVLNLDDIPNFPLIIKSSDTKGRKGFDKFYSNVAHKCRHKIEVSHDDLVITATEGGLGVGFAPREYISSDMSIISPTKTFEQDILLIYKRQSPIINDIILQIGKMK